MQKQNIKTISIADSDYPVEFTELVQPVNEFHAIGNLSLLRQRPRVAIIGSRRVTSYGRQVTLDLSRAAAKAGATIVSGLALGIDGLAHSGALQIGGQCIAVLPSSLHKIYPATNASLARQILNSNGLLISEYSQLKPPMKYCFIERNRLIAALADVILVTEAAVNSGSLHTVQFGLELGKTIAAVPGNITSAMSVGANHLFKDGAVPIFSDSDLLALLGVNEDLIKRSYRPEDAYEAAILDLLGSDETIELSIEELLAKSPLSVSDFNVSMTMLEIKGVIQRTTNNKWRLAK